jgi:hypothetical protein
MGPEHPGAPSKEIHMSRYPLRVMAVVVCTLLAGCSGTPDPQLTGEGTSVRGMSPAAPGTSLPLRGRCETSFDPPPFPPPPTFTQVDTGECELAHLGRVAFHSVKEVDLGAGTQTTTEATFTVADGDVIQAVGSGTSAPAGPGRLRFSAVLTFVGGTGRFADAAGEVHVEGVALLASSTATLEIVGGWITYERRAR